MSEPQVEELLDHRGQIESSVSDHLGRKWCVSQIHDLADKASHPSAVLLDGKFGVFAKLGLGHDAAEQFRCETAGLSAMSELAGVLTPTVVGHFLIPHGAVLVLKAVKIVERTKTQWEEVGRSLARFHSAKGHSFGFDDDSYWGNFRQDNRPLDKWHTFFWERSIEPRITRGLDDGHLTVDLAKQVERLGQRLETVGGPHVEPALVHGDAHQNNILSTLHGPVFVDPNVHFGHPELDLAFVDYFQPVPDALFAAYAEMVPIVEDFPERREIWRLPFYLAMVDAEGVVPHDRIRAVLDRFL